MKVFITREAQKQYYPLDKPNQRKVKKKLNLLEDNPFSGKKLTGRFTGLRSIQAWPYRIIYFVDKDNNEVWVTSIQHRQGAYR